MRPFCNFLPLKQLCQVFCSMMGKVAWKGRYQGFKDYVVVLLQLFCICNAQSASKETISKFYDFSTTHKRCKP